ncbi:MAG: hypothetical protein KHZ73_01235 [Lachnospiraceae bacterium]|nr:hypothetical protein [Lachnospiraceae bacterium]
MIAPRKLQFAAAKKRNENYQFRQFLKIHADEEELDQQFQQLHKELFGQYDCNRCRNCCKMYHGSVPAEDIQRDAEYLQMSREDFVSLYLDVTEEGGNR